MQISKAIGVLILASSYPGLACSPPPPQSLTDEERIEIEKQQEEDFINFAQNSQAIVEIRALTSSGENFSSMLVEIRKVHFGKAKADKVMKLRTVGDSLCGPGGLKRGQGGYTILKSGRQKTFNGLLGDHQIKLLQKAGLLAA
ncbi:hypothetical protein ACFOWX_11540 [Sphingorhabdus arenilitoris]|uniref:Uncharacterized protein n=1 Tax=Sphingorhabdus arenilitoris TaxID=1490041 RepID=A0ABV8RJF1_9SPHN